ncbi:MAG: UbiX family flavin prenyltransferase [Pseudomonadota bacterium]|nr:UbiX family flavin prenyltransferase [Pseudomonadota bacterium]
MKPMTITLALTGASGMPYGFRLLQCLTEMEEVSIQLLYSQAAQIVISQETRLTLPARPSDAKETLGKALGINTNRLRVYGREDYLSPVASGSNPSNAMVICPCSMGTLAAISQGLSDNLIERAADVMLKEQKKLILVPRETPLSAIHLEHMLRLAKMQAVILPPSPGFYTHPQTIADLIDFIVARILDHLGLTHALIPRWGENKAQEIQAGASLQTQG